MKSTIKRLVIIIIGVLLFNCADKKAKKANYVEHHIGFLNRIIKMPENYFSVSLDDYQKIIQESYTDSTLANSKILQIENMKANFHEYAFFLDEENIDNTFVIVSMPNPKPDRSIKNMLVRNIIASMRSKGKIQGFIYKNMENRFIDNWLIKIKGEKRYNDSEISVYATQYLAVNFGAFVSSLDKDVDFEDVLTE